MKTSISRYQVGHLVSKDIVGLVGLVSQLNPVEISLMKKDISLFSQRTKSVSLILTK